MSRSIAAEIVGQYLVDMIFWPVGECRREAAGKGIRKTNGVRRRVEKNGGCKHLVPWPPHAWPEDEGGTGYRAVRTEKRPRRIDHDGIDVDDQQLLDSTLQDE